MRFHADSRQRSICGEAQCGDANLSVEEPHEAVIHGEARRLEAPDR